MEQNSPLLVPVLAFIVLAGMVFVAGVWWMVVRSRGSQRPPANVRDFQPTNPHD